MRAPTPSALTRSVCMLRPRPSASARRYGPPTQKERKPDLCEGDSHCAWARCTPPSRTRSRLWLRQAMVCPSKQRAEHAYGLTCLPLTVCFFSSPWGRACCRPQSRGARSASSVWPTSAPRASGLASRTLCDTANVAASTTPCPAPAVSRSPAGSAGRRTHSLSQSYPSPAMLMANSAGQAARTGRPRP